MLVPEITSVSLKAARLFEETLDPARRKALGQYFTGPVLAKLLAHLAMKADQSKVVDPMAGHGDLLEAVTLVARERKVSLSKVEAVEIDREVAKFCKTRLEAAVGRSNSHLIKTTQADAFETQHLSPAAYDLVISNPPYVRYQSQKSPLINATRIRASLNRIISNVANKDVRSLWANMVESYSGHADLSIPSWMLLAILTKPGGRLALVVPATWRTREYAMIIRYVMLRFFQLEYVVADSQPGWFSDALVRTHLIVARRLRDEEALIPLEARTEWPFVAWIDIASKAANRVSLIGSAFKGDNPERRFADWLESGRNSRSNIAIHRSSLEGEWIEIKRRMQNASWYKLAEGLARNNVSISNKASLTLPEGLRSLQTLSEENSRYSSIEDSGISVGQGLRTGCNRFFYVTACKDDDNLTEVETSTTFGRSRLFLPTAVLLPILHRQSDIQAFRAGRLPRTRALSLANYLLPGDAKNAEVSSKRALMSDDLERLVKIGAKTRLESSNGLRIPELSAVRTNISSKAGSEPRFWYMLPPFTRRHTPDLFVARVNHESPALTLNSTPPILIDANFSSIWSDNDRWTQASLLALFKSTWMKLSMELVGTPMGGGALKLEAAQIRQIQIPEFSSRALAELHKVGKGIQRSESVEEVDELIMACVYPNASKENLSKGVKALRSRLRAAIEARRTHR